MKTKLRLYYSNKMTRLAFAVFCSIFYLSVFSYAEAASRIVVLGSSTAYGYGLTDKQYVWVARYRTYLQSIDSHNQVINLSYSGYSTYKVMPNEFTPPSGRPEVDVTRNISEALTYRPDAIIINLPTNDVGNYYDLEEIKANYETIVKLADMHNVPVWITTTQPRNFTDAVRQSRLFELNEYLLEKYGDKVIDFWTDLATTEGKIKTEYLQTNKDGIHLNYAGHKILFERVRDKGIAEICDKGKRSIYLVGGATDVLWSGSKSIPFIQNNNNPNIYTLECDLRHKNVDNGKQFRILNQPDIAGYGLFPKKNGEVLTESTTVVKKTSSLSNSNYRWTVPADKQGRYKLTVNLSDNTLKSEYLGDVMHTPNKLYLVGGSTEAGWDETKAIPFVRDEYNPNIFKLNCLLKINSGSEGDKFKILEQQGKEGYAWHPATNGQALEASGSINQRKSPESINYKWTIPTAKQGYYTLIVDVSKKTITAQYLGRVQVLPAKLYLIGGATAAGWDGTKGIPFTQDAENPNIFELECLLKHSTMDNGKQIRIIEQATVNGYGLFAKTRDQALAATNMYVEKSSAISNNNYRWTVPTAKQGYYKLTINITTKTLSAVYLGSNPATRRSAIDSADMLEDILTDEQGYVDITSSENDIHVLLYEIDYPVTVKVMGMDGCLVAVRNSKGENIVVNDLQKGLYIVSVTYGETQIARKILIK